jgi:hypothetical protein
MEELAREYFAAVPAGRQGVAYFRRFMSAMASSSRALRTGAGGVSVVV